MACQSNSVVALNPQLVASAATMEAHHAAKVTRDERLRPETRRQDVKAFQAAAQPGVSLAVADWLSAPQRGQTREPASSSFPQCGQLVGRVRPAASTSSRGATMGFQNS